ncbi:MAG TPA: sigma-70 family RNA polymerase sigma factor [Vicinamibacterales bacterium]|jgi:RNA polymerase sigma-70 factor (ECF subfamily)|nr:sigma-70 family RNA polymerase sigma factor [Vicinamibacterales bacterium]
MGDIPGPRESAESTVFLLERFRAGDNDALNRLFARYVPLLQRWASGRLPRWARDLTDTHDLVQDAALQTFKNIEDFEHRGEGALQAYLRQAVMNRIRDEFRRSARSPESTAISSGLLDKGTSPFERAVGAELLDAYDAALARLEVTEREAIIGRIELGLTYPELASAMNKPSSDAVRMTVARGLVRLAEEMGREER